jgi:hypothetical protein
MQTPLHTLDLVNTTNPDRRRTMRAERSAEASLSTAGRTPCDAMVTDVSHHGCCVETRADWLRPGRFVAIRLADGEPLQSIVRWSQDGFAGLELLRRIPDDRADWLALID